MSRSSNAKNTPQKEYVKVLPSFGVLVDKSKGFPLEALHHHLRTSKIRKLLIKLGPEDLRGHLESFDGAFRSTTATKKLITARAIAIL